MRAWNAALDLLAPGYTVACIGTTEELVRAAASRTGDSGLVIWCLLMARPPAAALPANCAIVRCEAASLPVLSHALDAALLELKRVDDAGLAELRRVLAPRGTLIIGPFISSEPSERLRSALAAFGFAVRTPVGSKRLVAFAP